jgi:PhoD-like phosphatase
VALTETFDGGTDGATIVAGGNFSSVQGTPTYSAANTIHGALAMSTSGTATGVRIDNPGTATHSGSCYFKPSGVTTGAMRAVQFLSSTNALLGALRFHSDGHIDISSPSSARLVASSLTYTDGAKIRLDWEFDYSGVNPVVTCRIFTSPEASTPAETIGPATLVTTSLMQRWSLGANGGAAGQVLIVDTFREVDGLSWIGPFAPAPTPGTVTHAWVGAPNPSGFRVRAKLASATSVRLAVSTSSSMTSPVFEMAQAPDGNSYVDFTVTGKTASTQYWYQLADTPAGGSETLIGPVGRARTLPAAGAGGFVFAFGGCTTNSAADPTAHDDVRTWDPDFLCHLGDFHYSNPTSTDPAVHRGAWETQITSAAGLAQLIREIPSFYVRSDHDAGPGDNADHGVEAPASIAAYQQIVPHPPLADVLTPKHGLYFSQVVRRVRFIFVDIRNIDRSPGLDPQSTSKTMLGSTQKAWLKSELLQPEPVKVIVSDVGWLGAASTANGEDKWWSYADERAEIGAFIAANRVQCLLLHSDTHAIAEAAPTSNPDGGFAVLCAAPFHNIGGGRNLGSFDSSYNNAGGNCRQYGRVVVTDNGNTISFAFSGWDAVAGVVRVSRTVAFTTVSPAGIATREAWGTPTVSTGLAVTGIPSGESWGTPVVAAATPATLSPAGIGAAEAWGTPTLSGPPTPTLFRFVSPTFRTQEMPFDVDGGRPRGPVTVLDRGMNVYRLGGQWFAELYPTAERWAAADRQYLGGHVHNVDQAAADELTAAGFGSNLTPIVS